MSILDFLRGSLKPRNPPDFAVDSNDQGETIYSDDLVSEIKAELERRRGERAAYELQWSLNANFLAGHQNCEIDTFSGTIITEEPIERADRERRCYNRIAPLMETRDAHLGSVGYDMVVTPRSGDADDIQKAAVSSRLLQYVQTAVDFPHKIDQLRRWMETCGTAFTLSWWDTEAGDIVAREVREEILADGTVHTSARDIHEGEIAMGLLTAYEVFPHSLVVESIADQHDIIIEQVLDVGEIRDRYGIEVEAEDVEAYTMSPLPNAVTGHGRSNTVFGIDKATRKGCAKVITYLENPSKTHPDGRLVIIVKDEIVYYGTLPAGVMPVQAFKAKVQTGLFFGKSVIQELIPLQRSYNAVKNKIVDHIATVANAPWLFPSGSVDIDAIALSGIESGSLIEYRPEHGKPEIVSYPDPPSIIMAEEQQIAQDMEYTAGVSQLMVYGAAASSASGKALDTRREIDQTRMSATADAIRDGVAGMAKIWLKLNKAFSTGYRVMKISGDGDVGAVYTWSAEDINSYDVEFSAENELRNSKEQQKQAFIEAYQLGLFTDESGRLSQSFKRRAWDLFRLGNPEDVMDLDDLQRKNAERENTFLEAGSVPERYRYDNDEIHLETHLRYALSTDFWLLRRKMPEFAEYFDRHIEEHRAAIAARQQNMQMQAMAMQAAQNNQNNNKGGNS